MKNVLALLICFVSVFSAISQDKSESGILVDGKLYLDSLYTNKEELIIFSGVHKFDSLKASEIKNKIKNWASLNFVNLKEVLLSETDDQIVLNYISSSLYVKSLGIKTSISWYIRLLIQFKDGRVKYTYFDDGNVQVPASQYSPGSRARAYRLKDYFAEKNGVYLCKNAYTQGMVDLRSSLKANFESIILTKETEKKNGDDNW